VIAAPLEAAQHQLADELGAELLPRMREGAQEARALATLDTTP